MLIHIQPRKMTTWFGDDGFLDTGMFAEFNHKLFRGNYEWVRSHDIVTRAIDELRDLQTNPQGDLSTFIELSELPDKTGLAMAIVESDPNVIGPPKLGRNKQEAARLVYRTKDPRVQAIVVDSDNDGTLVITDYIANTPDLKAMSRATEHAHNLCKIAYKNSEMYPVSIDEHYYSHMLSFFMSFVPGEYKISNDALRRIRYGDPVSSPNLTDYLITNLSLREEDAVAITQACGDMVSTEFPLEYQVNSVPNIGSNQRLVVRTTTGKTYVMTAFRNRAIARAEQSSFKLSEELEFVQSSDFSEPIEIEDLGVYITIQDYQEGLQPGCPDLFYLAAALGQLHALGEKMVDDSGLVIPTYERLMEYDQIMELVQFGQGRHKVVCPSTIRDLKNAFSDSLDALSEYPLTFVNGDAKGKNFVTRINNTPCLFDWDWAGFMHAGWDLVQILLDPRRDIDETYGAALQKTYWASYCDAKGTEYKETDSIITLEMATLSSIPRWMNDCGFHADRLKVKDPTTKNTLYMFQELLKTA